MSKNDKLKPITESKGKAKTDIGSQRRENLDQKFHLLLLDAQAKKDLLQHLEFSGSAPLKSDYVLDLEKSILGKMSDRFKYIKNLTKALDVTKKDSTTKDGIHKWCQYIFFKEGQGSPLEALLNTNPIFTKDALKEQGDRNQMIIDLRASTLKFICDRLECSIDELASIFTHSFPNFILTKNAISQYESHSPKASAISQYLNGEITKDMWSGLDIYAQQEKKACAGIMGDTLKITGLLFLNPYEENLFSSIKDLLDNEFFGKKAPIELLINDGSPRTTKDKRIEIVKDMRISVLEYLCDTLKCEPEVIKEAYEKMGEGRIGDDVVKECQQRKFKPKSEKEKKVTIHVPKGSALENRSSKGKEKVGK